MLIEPDTDSRFRGQSTSIELKWKSVGNLQPDERYQIPITFTKGGQKQTWKLETGATTLKVPRELYGQADEPESLYQWQVLVVKVEGEKRVPISPASDVRTFHWYK